MATVEGEVEFSVTAGLAVAGEVEFSVTAPLAVEGPAGFRVRTDGVIDGPIPFSVSTPLVVEGPAPCSVTTGLLPGSAGTPSVPDYSSEAAGTGAGTGPGGGPRIIRPKPKVTISPSLSAHGLVEVTRTRGVGQGWTASIELAEAVDPDTWGVEDTFRITFDDGLGHSSPSPPMVLTPRTRALSAEQGPSTTLQLIDLATWRLSNNGQSLPGQNRRALLADVAAALAAQCGVVVTGLPDQVLPEEQVRDQKAWDVLNRFAAAYGYRWRVLHGSVQFFPAFQTGGSAGRVPLTQISETLDYTRRYTDWAFGKTAPVRGRTVQNFNSTGFKRFNLAAPLQRLGSIQRRNLLGYVDWIALLDAGGKVISWHVFGAGTGAPAPPRDGSWPAVAVACTVFPDPLTPQSTNANVTLTINGREVGQVGENVEGAFHYPYASGQTPVRPVGGTWNENLWLRQSDVEALAPTLLGLKNLGVHTVTADGPLWCGADLMQTLAFPGIASSQLDSITESWTAGQVPTTSYVGMVTA